MRCLRWPVVSLCLLARLGRALLPPPLDPLCLPRSARPEYCFADGFNRTFPLGPSQQPPDPFHANMTIRTCAYLCQQQHAGMTLAALEAGAQCFCANASGLAAAIASGQSPSRRLQRLLRGQFAADLRRRVAARRVRL